MADIGRIQFAKRWFRWQVVGPVLLFVAVSVVLTWPNYFVFMLLEQPFGFIDKSGNYVINLESYCWSHDPIAFSEGLSLTEQGSDYTMDQKHASPVGPVYIDTAGREVIKKTAFFGARAFSNNFAAVMLHNKNPFGPYLETNVEHEKRQCMEDLCSWSYIDKTGQLMKWGPFSAVEDFSEGLAAVRPMRSMKWHFIDRTGNTAFAGKFDAVGKFSEGLAAACVDNKWGVINKTGKWILKPSYTDKIGEYHEGLAAVARERDGQVDYLNRHGQLHLSVQKNCGIAKSFVDGEYYYKPGASADLEASEGLIVFENNSKFGYVDLDGKIVIESQFACCWPFVEGRALYQKVRGGKFGFIDHTGKSITGCKYFHAENYSEGLAVVDYDGDREYSHYIDKAGNDAFKRSYKFAKSFHEGRAFAGQRTGYF